MSDVDALERAGWRVDRERGEARDPFRSSRVYRLHDSFERSEALRLATKDRNAQETNP